MVSSRSVPAALCVALCLLAGVGSSLATVTPPPVRALELPAGVTSLAADDVLLAPILGGATSSNGATVAHNQAGKTLVLGKNLVTWTDPSDGTTLARYVYLYPHGHQVLGATDNLRVFEHNGARHVLYDNHGRLHAIYNDGRRVWYRLAVRSGPRWQWGEPVQVNDASSPIGKSTYGTRGQTFVLLHESDGSVVVQCTWSSTWPWNRAVLARRLTVNLAGTVALDPIVTTGLTGSFQCIAADSTGRLHLAVEVYSAMDYMSSADGVTWTNYKSWVASQNSCQNFRFPNLVIDSKDRVHLLWQAEGYLGYSGSSLWWVGFHSILNQSTGQWSSISNVLAGIPGWGAPSSGRQILFAYPNMVIDERDNLHLSWHGTARSYRFAWDDVFYLRKTYNPASDTWSAWGDYATLHARDHFNTGNGEDDDFTWVPSMAYRAGSDDICAVIMIGAGDDEVDDPAVNLTDSMLKRKIDGIWQAGFENVINTAGLRSWYANVPPQVMVDPNGHAWLDMIWVDGTQLYTGGTLLNDYNVLLRRIDLGGGMAGDCNGDGRVDIFDLLIMVNAFGQTRTQLNFDRRADLNFSGAVELFDLLEVVNRFGEGG